MSWDPTIAARAPRRKPPGTRPPLRALSPVTRAPLLVLLLVLAGGPAAGETPLPPERPPELSPAGAAPEVAGPDLTGPNLPPLPPERPDRAGPAPAVSDVPLPPPRPDEIPLQTAGPPDRPDDAACRERIAGLGVKAEPLPPIADGLCGAARPLRVTALPNGVALTPPVTVICPVAEALAGWSAEVRRAAEDHLKAPLAALQTGGSYECRGQNHDPNAKMSEHAFANAADIMAFAFEKRPALPVTAAAAGSPEAAFLAEVRAKACAIFTTVLGPGADATHADHLHLDLRERRPGVHFCQ